MMYSLTTKQQNALILINFVPEEIVRQILQHKVHSETEDARSHYSRQMSVFNMDNYYYWHEYDRKLSQLIQSIKIMNTPNFWKLVNYNDQGTISGTQTIDSYYYISIKDSWWTRKVRGTLQKVNLLNREYHSIYPIWQRNREYPYHNIGIFFSVEFIGDQPDDQMTERWVLYN